MAIPKRLKKDIIILAGIFLLSFIHIITAVIKIAAEIIIIIHCGKWSRNKFRKIRAVPITVKIIGVSHKKGFCFLFIFFSFLLFFCKKLYKIVQLHYIFGSVLVLFVVANEIFFTVTQCNHVNVLILLFVVEGVNNVMIRAFRKP